MATLKEAVSTLLKNGAKRVNDIVVNNINVTAFESYTRISLSLDKPVEGYVQNEDGSYEKGETSVIFVSLYSLTTLFKDCDDIAFAVNEITKHPQSLQVILSRAKISVIQEYVTAGEVRTNPFTGKEDEDVIDHDTIFNHVVEVSLNDKGKRALERIEDKMLGII